MCHVDDADLLPGKTIYAANFFEPKQWVTGQAKDVAFGGSAGCCHLAEKRSCGTCPGPTVTLDAAWLRSLLQPVLAFRDAHDVPIYIDQWGVHSDAGASAGDPTAYLGAVLALFDEARLSWAYWIWRLGYSCPGDYAIYCGPASDGSYARFDAATEQLRKYIGAF